MNKTKLYRFIPWIIVFMAFGATALDFLDRQILSVSIIEIKKQIPISPVEFGFINSGFLVGYALMFTVAGILIDRYGSRAGLAVSVGVWSLANGLHGIASNATHFSFFRFLLGVGEGGAFPGAIKAAVEWVPKKRQALANGIVIGGAAIGASLAGPLCNLLFNFTDWRGIFYITTAAGFLWILIWYLVSGRNMKKKALSVSDEVKEVKIETQTEKHKVSLSKLLKLKETWIFILMRFMFDPVLYFYMFWIPRYLNETRGNTTTQIGNLFWIPFLAMGVSNMFGGWISDVLYIKKGSINYARKMIMGISALLTVPALLVEQMPTTEWIIAILTLVFFAHGLWITNYITSISDSFGKTATSTVVGMSGTAGAVSGVFLNYLVGLIVTKFSYEPVWWYAGLMYLVPFIIFMIFIPKLKLLNLESLQTASPKIAPIIES